ncbi:MAG: ABC transporter ATP-binding protein [Sulfolobus sp.]|nr:ABC transporter ATP-binding protein [Sulfolobus sp.]
MCIYVQGVEKKFGNTLALNNVSFTIPCGEKWALLGPNGAGKSTLLKVISGLIKPDSGVVKVMGEDSKSPKVRALLGYLPEDADPFPGLSVIDNLKFISAIRGVDESQIYELIEILGLRQYINYKASALSRGNKQKLAIAMAILHKPRILLLDEPLNYLDIPSQETVLELLKGFRDSTFLVSTHILSVADKLTEKALIISNGTIRWLGDFSSLRSMSNESIEQVVSKIIRGNFP